MAFKEAVNGFFSEMTLKSKTKNESETLNNVDQQDSSNRPKQSESKMKEMFLKSWNNFKYGKVFKNSTFKKSKIVDCE